MKRIFLLSPANLGGVRSQRVLNGPTGLDWELGELFSSISGLYFRGKLQYAEAFGAQSPLIITAGFGLMPAHSRIGLDQLKQMAAVPIDASEARYRDPLQRDARALDVAAEIVLLGSLATPKYLEPLLHVAGSRLLYPAEFAGLGDMSRGALMLRCVRLNRELAYVRATPGTPHRRSRNLPGSEKPAASPRR